MNKQNTQGTFAVPAFNDQVALVIAYNGGSIQVDVLLDTATSEWVSYRNFTSTDDAVQILTAAGLTFRVTPSGGAEYAVALS